MYGPGLSLNFVIPLETMEVKSKTLYIPFSKELATLYFHVRFIISYGKRFPVEIKVETHGFEKFNKWNF
jgi:hypothetical protein